MAEANNVVRLHAVDGSNQGTFPVANEITDIVYDLIYDRTTYIWASWSSGNAGNGVVTRLLTHSAGLAAFPGSESMARGKVFRYIPIGSAAVIVCIGIGITYMSIR